MIAEKNIEIEAYDYPLPADRIAFFPKEQRDSSQLLVYRNHTITDSNFDAICNFIDNQSVLIFNDSKVIHARLLVHNATGAAIEIFCLEPLYPTSEMASAFAQTEKVVWKCMVGNAKKWKYPLQFPVSFDDKTVMITAEKGENSEGAFAVTFRWKDNTVSFADWIEVYGKMPLPPYIKRNAEKSDDIRYQTIYAKYDGSVAAPTAGLHFSESVMQSIAAKGIKVDYVTLHVGAGTFKPVSTATIGEHFMHHEQIVITASFIDRLLKYRDKKIIAVGTTVARTLESLFIVGAKLFLHLDNPLSVQQWEVYENKAIMQVPVTDALTAIAHFLNNNNIDTLTATTQLIIVPSYHHKICKGLITNFHQPKSTLLLLIASFVGDDWKSIYRHALLHNYRFLSFGDSNLYLP